MRGGRLEEGDELVAHVDERMALALAAQGELENPAVEGERRLHVADLERDVIDADQPRLGPARGRVVVHPSGLPFGNQLCALTCAGFPRRQAEWCGLPKIDKSCRH